jgi:hypothetical protein
VTHLDPWKSERDKIKKLLADSREHADAAILTHLSVEFDRRLLPGLNYFRLLLEVAAAANLDLETITAQLALRIDEELHGKGGKDDGKGKPSIAGLTANLMARHGHDSLANTEDLN